MSKKTATVASAAAAVFLLLATLIRAEGPAVVSGDWTVRDFRFATGETLPELKLHYLTLGEPRRDATGRRAQRRADPARHRRDGPAVPRRRTSPRCSSDPASCSMPRTYFIILPDGIGHGQRSKPSDGLRAQFPALHLRTTW